MKPYHKKNTEVQAKKSFGQHFLRDLSAAITIVDSLTAHGGYTRVLEIGPGMGVLTKFLLEKPQFDVHVVEVDRESVAYLKEHFKNLPAEKIHEADFLKLDLNTLAEGKPMAIIGNFPYNISSQILFKALENKDLVPEVVGMFQKEVALRVASKPGKKDYGILSVLLQAYYDIDYLLSVPPEAFDPPPKVQSGVIRLRRNGVKALNCNEKLFTTVVKTGFNQRRKTLRNALKPLGVVFEHTFLEKRAEQLSVADFIELTNVIEKLKP